METLVFPRKFELNQIFLVDKDKDVNLVQKIDEELLGFMIEQLKCHLSTIFEGLSDNYSDYVREVDRYLDAFFQITTEKMKEQTND